MIFLDNLSSFIFHIFTWHCCRYIERITMFFETSCFWLASLAKSEKESTVFILSDLLFFQFFFWKNGTVWWPLVNRLLIRFHKKSQKNKNKKIQMPNACEYCKENWTFLIWLQQQIDGLPHSQEAFNYMAHDSLIPSICLLFSFPRSIDHSIYTSLNKRDQTNILLRN